MTDFIRLLRGRAARRVSAPATHEEVRSRPMGATRVPFGGTESAPTSFDVTSVLRPALFRGYLRSPTSKSPFPREADARFVTFCRGRSTLLLTASSAGNTLSIAVRLDGSADRHLPDITSPGASDGRFSGLESRPHPGPRRRPGCAGPNPRRRAVPPALHRQPRGVRGTAV